MRKTKYFSLIVIYLSVLLCLVLFPVLGSKTVTTISENYPLSDRFCIVIDAGHGGVDGGATSCTGVLESKINLEIALRLDDLMHLLGYKTVMIRNTDRSIHTHGNSIAAKKVSDLKERVRIINSNKNAVFISIHQNYFSDSKYSGAQVFYANSPQSKNLAKAAQTSLNATLCVNSNRQIKPSKGIYLMENTTQPGILVECGFISNHSEEAKLRNSEYQKKISCVLATTVCNFLDRESFY